MDDIGFERYQRLMGIAEEIRGNNLPDGLLGRMFTSQIKKSRSIILYINRTRDNIISTRPELINDYKLNRKIAIYNHLAETTKGWFIIDNNHSLKNTQTNIAELIKDKTGIE